MTPTAIADRYSYRVLDPRTFALIAEIDQKLSRQLDEIIHNPAFQKLESAWRGIKFLVDRQAMIACVDRKSVV